MRGPSLTFRPVDNYRPGDVERLLTESYADLADEFKDLMPSHFDWHEADREVFENPDTVGACTFITCVGGELIGLGSFDPRQRPDLGIVGHNCILPGFRGQGYGKYQMQEILRRLIATGHTHSQGNHRRPPVLPAGTEDVSRLWIPRSTKA